MKIAVNEIFYTIQSEGMFTGKPALFIRTQGCPVQCKWCDTKHTWAILPSQQVTLEEILEKNITSINKKYCYIEPNDILTQCIKNNAKLVVITGGEPCVYDLNEITKLLIDNGINVQIETSGTQPISCDNRTYICVSPKIGICRKNITMNLEACKRADYIKMVITNIIFFVSMVFFV